MPQCRHRMRLKNCRHSRRFEVQPAAPFRPRYPETEGAFFAPSPFRPCAQAAVAWPKKIPGDLARTGLQGRLELGQDEVPIDLWQDCRRSPFIIRVRSARGVIRRLQLSEADLDHGLGPHAMWAGRDAYVQIAIARFPSRHPLALSGTRSEAQSGKHRHAPAGSSDVFARPTDPRVAGRELTSKSPRKWIDPHSRPRLIHEQKSSLSRGFVAL